MAIRAAKPGQTVWDSSLKGFGLRVGKTTRTFIVLIGSGRRQKIGQFPIISLATARAEAKRIIAEKQLGRVKPTHVAFNDAKAAYLAVCEKKNRPSTIRDYRWRLDRHYPFERKSVGDITPREIIKHLNTLDDTPSEKKYAFAVGRSFFKFCVRQHYIDRSPMTDMETPPTGKARSRVLKDNELKAIYKTALKGQTTFHHIVVLLILLLQRRTETAALQFEWIGEDTITLPAEITKNGREHTFPIARPVHDAIARIPKLSNQYLFPAARQRKETTTVFAGWGKPKSAFDKECGVTGWTLHDLRRTGATILRRLGVSLEVTESILNHVSGTKGGIVSVYQKWHFIPEMRDAFTRYHRFLDELVSDDKLPNGQKSPIGDAPDAENSSG